MALAYRFKKIKLEDGNYVSRPEIPVQLSHGSNSIDVAALIDSGCDTTIIPESIARYLDLNLSSEETKIQGYREKIGVIPSLANITFIGRKSRISTTLSNVPVLVVPETEDSDTGVILGVERIFDEFEIVFKKSAGRVILKKTSMARY